MLSDECQINYLAHLMNEKCSIILVLGDIIKTRHEIYRSFFLILRCFSDLTILSSSSVFMYVLTENHFSDPSDVIR